MKLILSLGLLFLIGCSTAQPNCTWEKLYPNDFNSSVEICRSFKGKN